MSALAFDPAGKPYTFSMNRAFRGVTGTTTRSGATPQYPQHRMMKACDRMALDEGCTVTRAMVRMGE